jgi:ABC-2 type transport system ATP-binding protein
VEFDKMADLSKLTELQNISRVTLLRKNIWQIEAEGDEDIRPAIFNFAVANNLTVLSLQKQQSNLEEVFRHLTS